MLNIYIEQNRIDIFVDTEVTLNFENPICLSDRIPVPYSFGFDIPKTANNLTILKFSNRIQSRHTALRKMVGHIMFGTSVVAMGEFQIEECGDTIELNFTAAILPIGIEKKMYKQNLGSIEFLAKAEMVSGVLNTMQAQFEYTELLWDNASEVGVPDYVACPLHIKDSAFEAVEGEIDPFSNQRKMFINACHSAGYVHSVSSSLEYGAVISKVIPAFRVGWLIDKLLGANVTVGTEFATALKRLMLVCTYHPKYQIEDLRPIFDIDRQTKKVSINFADFMPDVSASEFLTEMLKLACSSLYVKNDKYIIETNTSVVCGKAKHDWVGRLSDEQTVWSEPKQKYELSLKNNDDMDSVTDRPITVVSTIYNMVTAVRTAISSDQEFLPCYYVSSTKQYFEAYINTHLSSDDIKLWDFKLLAQEVNNSESTQDEDEDSDVSSFDMNIKASVITPTVMSPVFNNIRYVPGVHSNGKMYSHQNYCPVVEIQEKRSDDLILGLWGAKLTDEMNNEDKKHVHRFYQPVLTNSAVLPDGTALDGVSLSIGNYQRTIKSFHNSYKKWIETDKRILKSKICLNESEISQLDLRDKVNYDGVDFIIKNLSVTLRNGCIDPAEVELIEVPKSVLS